MSKIKNCEERGSVSGGLLMGLIERPNRLGFEV